MNYIDLHKIQHNCNIFPDVEKPIKIIKIRTVIKENLFELNEAEIIRI